MLRSVSSPVTVKRTEVGGATTPADAYAVVIAVTVSLMFVALLLASGLLALEREEHAFGRLVRGLVSRGDAAGREGGARRPIGLAGRPDPRGGISLVVSLEWGRFGLWLVALLFAGAASGRSAWRSAR